MVGRNIFKNSFIKEYIELSTNFNSKETAKNITALYDFKDELEKSNEQNAKKILVDVYKLLELYTDAYELHIAIMDKTDKKQLKKLGHLKEYAISHSNNFAIKKPKTAIQEKAQFKKSLLLLKFKYHPNPLKTEAFKDDMAVICDCCGKETSIYYQGMYSAKNVDYLCPSCIASGKAAEKFGGVFIQDADTYKTVDDPNKTHQLFKCTPGYESWQGENWLACCNDYCAFLGDVGTMELDDMGIADEVFNELAYSDIRKYLTKAGSCAGYLFQCLHCNKYHLNNDCD